MRRMMHAALFASAIISLASSVYAQAPQNSLIVNNADGIHAPSPTDSSVVYSGNAAYSEIPSYSAGPQFLKFGSCRPHSPVATLMQREYVSPNLWAGYAQQRAALVSHMMRHVDGTCGCCQTYDTACHTACGSGCGTNCGTNCGPAVKNRYKLSTLHAAPSSACGTVCETNCETNCENSCETGGCETNSAHGKLQAWKPSSHLLNQSAGTH